MSVRSDNVFRGLHLARDQLPLLDSRPSIRWITVITLVASLILAAIGARIGPELRMRPGLSNTDSVVDPDHSQAVGRRADSHDQTSTQ